MTEPRWPFEAPVELLAEADAYIEMTAGAYDAIALLPGIGELLREAWATVRPRPTCDCPMDPHHRWNCALTPIWAQTIRDLDTNPWTVMRPRELANTPPLDGVIERFIQFTNHHTGRQP